MVFIERRSLDTGWPKTNFTVFTIRLGDIHRNTPGLSQSVAAVHCLLVIVWIEAYIVQDHDICRRQVDPQPSCEYRQAVSVSGGL